jgi:cell division protein ZapA (FtsZ GTPase activity inhibitor)
VSESMRVSVVTVEIAGEEYKLRAMATPEYTQQCAALVNDAIAEVLQHGSFIQAPKAAILAALSLADELMRTRAELDRLNRDSAGFARRLADDLDARIRAAGDLATPG